MKLLVHILTAILTGLAIGLILGIIVRSAESAERPSPSISQACPLYFELAPMPTTKRRQPINLEM